MDSISFMVWFSIILTCLLYSRSVVTHIPCPQSDNICPWPLGGVNGAEGLEC